MRKLQICKETQYEFLFKRGRVISSASIQPIDPEDWLIDDGWHNRGKRLSFLNHLLADPKISKIAQSYRDNVRDLVLLK